MEAGEGLWPLGWSLVAFAAGAAAIAWSGPKLASLAATLAERTGLGQAVSGAIFLGASTSLSGSVTSAVAAVDGHAQLALSNAIGGIATQTVFLAFADMQFRKANLEHAAASATNLFQAALLCALLAILLLAMIGLPVSVFGVHPATVLLFAGYVLGMRLALRTHREPMWRAERTMLTESESLRGGADDPRRSRVLWSVFAGYGAVLAASGAVLARSGASLSEHTGLDESIVGGLLTAVTTSLPELVTAIAAVRMGAVNLAIGDIIGGNVFDTLFACVADLLYRGGSIYHAVGTQLPFLVALTVLMTAVLMLGMVRRERSGFGNIGFESTLLLAIYVSGFAALFAW